MNSYITIYLSFLLLLNINNIKTQLSRGMFEIWISESPLMEAAISILIL